MKKLAFLFLVLFATVTMSFAQNPPHPNGGNGPGGGNTPVGGGAPIDGGLSIMMILATAYAFKKSGKVIIQKSKN
jgi:hypothetical protein